MNYFFNPVFSNKNQSLQSLTKVLRNYFARTSTFSTEEEYNTHLNELVAILRSNPLNSPTPLFKKEIEPINQHKPLTEEVIWGGVSLKKVDVARDLIQKLLVVKQYGILGFEIHEQKLEKLLVLEGMCLVIFSNHNKPSYKKGKVTLRIAKPGDRFVFQPKDEHGIIALTDCVIQETSTNHLDDLVYIFSSRQFGLQK